MLINEVFPAVKKKGVGGLEKVSYLHRIKKVKSIYFDASIWLS